MFELRLSMLNIKFVMVECLQGRKRITQRITADVIIYRIYKKIIQTYSTRV